MLNYKKGKNVEEELTKDNIPIECLPTDFLWMHVKGGTTVSNVIDYAKLAIDKGEHRSMVWSGSGGGITKTISCVEILKRNYDLHQVTRLTSQNIEEYWDPIMDGLETIVAKRTIPSIHILLSLDAIDPNVSGYQFSKNKSKFWIEQDKPQKSNNQQHHQQRSPPGSGNQNNSKAAKYKNNNHKKTTKSPKRPPQNQQ